jgi:hypothetical protein
MCHTAGGRKETVETRCGVGREQTRREGADVFRGEVRREEFIPLGKELPETIAAPGLDHCFEGRSRWGEASNTADAMAANG